VTLTDALDRSAGGEPVQVASHFRCKFGLM
jgi:hypothetical protein